MVWRWITVIALLATSIWLGYLGAFNWWAAGGPPTPHPEVYATRSNVFFGLAAVSLAAAVVVTVITLRRRGTGSGPES